MLHDFLDLCPISKIVQLQIVYHGGGQFQFLEIPCPELPTLIHPSSDLCPCLLFQRWNGLCHAIQSLQWKEILWQAWRHVPLEYVVYLGDISVRNDSTHQALQ